MSTGCSPSLSLSAAAWRRSAADWAPSSWASIRNIALKYLVYFLIAVSVGGLGSVAGVYYASLLLGVLDFVLKLYVPKGGTIFIYALTILLLLWRPQGLFGRKET